MTAGLVIGIVLCGTAGAVVGPGKGLACVVLAQVGMMFALGVFGC